VSGERSLVIVTEPAPRLLQSGWWASEAAQRRLYGVRSASAEPVGWAGAGGAGGGAAGGGRPEAVVVRTSPEVAAVALPQPEMTVAAVRSTAAQTAQIEAVKPFTLRALPGACSA
jgi:hypothetical protein